MFSLLFKKGGTAMNKKIKDKIASIVTFVMSEDFKKSSYNVKVQMLNMQLGELVNMILDKNNEDEKNRKCQQFHCICRLIAFTVILLIAVLILSIICCPESTIPNLIISAITSIVGFVFGRITPNKNECN